MFAAWNSCIKSTSIKGIRASSVDCGTLRCAQQVRGPNWQTRPHRSALRPQRVTRWRKLSVTSERCVLMSCAIFTSHKRHPLIEKSRKVIISKPHTDLHALSTSLTSWSRAPTYRLKNPPELVFAACIARCSDSEPPALLHCELSAPRRNHETFSAETELSSNVISYINIRPKTKLAETVQIVVFGAETVQKYLKSLLND